MAKKPKPEPRPKNWRWIVRFAEKFERRVHELNLSFSKVRERMVQAWEAEGREGAEDERMPATTTTLARWRRRESAPDLFDLRLLAKALEVPIAYLADESLANLDDVPGVGDARARKVLELANRIGLDDAASMLQMCAPLPLWEVSVRLLKPSVEPRPHGSDNGDNPKEKPPHGRGGSHGHGGLPTKRG